MTHQAAKRRARLLEGNPLSLMIELGIPAILGMAVVGLYNLMDSVFVGQMVGAAQMGAVSLAYPFTLVNGGTAAMLGVGSASVLSRAIGQEDEETVRAVMGNIVALVLLFSAAITALGMTFARRLLMLAGASGAMLEDAEGYLRVVFAGSVFVNFFQSANMVIRGEGRIRQAMAIIACGAMLNIALDPLFIAVMNRYGRGIDGAAYATVLSQAVQAGATALYFARKDARVSIGRIRVECALLGRILSVGVSALLMQVLTLAQQTVIYRVAARYGGAQSQIQLGAALRVWNFAFVPLWGISQGFQPAVGTNYGARRYGRVKALTAAFMAGATALSLLFYLPVEIAPAKVLSLLITDEAMARAGARDFRVMFSTYILQGTFIIAVTLFQALGKARRATALVLLRQVILFIPLCEALPGIAGLGARGVWLAIALTDALLVLITLPMTRSELRRLPADGTAAGPCSASGIRRGRGA